MKKIILITLLAGIGLVFLAGCESREDEYEACMNRAYSVYVANWAEACDARGLVDDCSLPADISKRLDDQLGKYEDKCLAVRLN